MYQAGKHFSDGVARLHINESPRVPPRGAIEAATAALEDAPRYPDPEGSSLRERIAEFHGVSVDSVVVGAGGDGLLDAAFRAFGRGAVALTRPTYGVLNDLAHQHASSVETVDWAARPAFKDHAVSLYCVVNPNSPTGTWLPPDELASLLPDDGPVVVIDEAYAPFVEQSMIPLLDDHPRWLVVRSFSKIYSLASLRIGYAVGAFDLVDRVRAFEGPYPVTGVALAAAEAALQDSQYLAEAVAQNREIRGRLSVFLAESGWDPGMSRGNFLFARPPRGDARTWHDALLSDGVAVRLFPHDDVERLRISVGRPQELERLMNAISSRGSGERTLPAPPST